MTSGFKGRRYGAYCGLLAGCVWAFGTLLLAATNDGYRTWSDASGKFSIKAKFVEIVEGRVTLERENGSRRIIALEKLSKADHDFLQSLTAAASPFENATPSPANKSPAASAPAAPSPPATPPATPSTTTVATVAKSPTPASPDDENASKKDVKKKDAEPDDASINWFQLKQVDTHPNEHAWKITPTAAPSWAAAEKPTSVRLPTPSNPQGYFRGLVASPTARQGAVFFATTSGLNNSTLISVCDLAAGRLLRTFRTNGSWIASSLSDSGQRVLVRSKAVGGAPQKLEIWNLTGKKLQREKSWTPYADLQHAEGETSWASFAGDDHIITVNGNGRFVVWNASTVAPLYWFQATPCRPAVSHDRKHLAFISGNMLELLDIKAGEIVAATTLPPCPTYGDVSLSFTPKGTRIVCLGFSRLLVVNAADGTLHRNIGLHGAPINIRVGDAPPEPACSTEECLLGSQGALYDMEKEAYLWHYQGAESFCFVNGVCWFAVRSREGQILRPLAVPHPPADAAIQKAVSSPDFFPFKPGVAVRLNVNLIQDAAHRKKVAAILTKKLEANGCRVGGDGPLEMIASIELASAIRKNESTPTPPIPRILAAPSYETEQYFCRIKMVYCGQSIWEYRSLPPAWSPSGYFMNAGLSPQSSPLECRTFELLEIPKTIQKPTVNGEPGIGVTNLNSQETR